MGHNVAFDMSFLKMKEVQTGIVFNNPLLRFFAPVTPGFLLPALVPLYFAWFFLHAAVLPDALAAGLHGDGDAFISTGERNCRVDIPNPVPSVNPVPGTDFFEFSCQISCSLVFQETILSNFDNFESLQLERFFFRRSES